MEIYITGKIVSKNKNYIILDNNGVGHLLYVVNTDNFIKGENRKIYIYHWENDFQRTTYGFENFRERILFEDLTTISGIGPKTALVFLTEGWEKGINYIAEGDWEEISKYPYISQKIARQIVFEFQNKYKKILLNLKTKDEKNENSPFKGEIGEYSTFESTVKLDKKVANELEDTLKILGFKKKQIDYAISSLEPNDNLEFLVEEAIKLISNAREFRNQA
ncbi:Holliday junction branch migration protein RuvA [Mesomycoplasma molare]|uniref:Holliday junction branch migration complex subunit RuvA n=1 Tax=Mesomycoplasma molare TaxID=171288 RepID=A0ABY5TXR0_9BACT|nr:Holliday junction branch migration protein RuvA [Mesomycoplasma molare]UWD34346.1 Holliday junction branch migration protein RuvA [Mesomycoplasma molare]